MTKSPEDLLLEHVQKVVANEGEVRCAVCAAPVGGEVTACSQCETLYHQACWAYNQGCAVYGCRSAPARPTPVVLKLSAKGSRWNSLGMTAAGLLLIVAGLAAYLSAPRLQPSVPSPGFATDSTSAPDWRRTHQLKPAPGHTFVNIGPETFDPELSHWNVVGATYEGNPAIGKMGATHLHAYGRDIGSMVYHFAVPEGPIRHGMVSARLSSEYAGYSGPAGGFSDVQLLINGVECGSQRVIADNGSGQFYWWRVPGEILKAGKSNVLELRVDRQSQYHHGIDVYGKAVVPEAEDAGVRVVIE